MTNKSGKRDNITTLKVKELNNLGIADLVVVNVQDGRKVDIAEVTLNNYLLGKAYGSRFERTVEFIPQNFFVANRDRIMTAYHKIEESYKHKKDS